MSPVVTYECPLAGDEHAVPGPDVRIMKVGDGGFVIACDCSEEELDDADEEPHPTTDHLVNVYARDPSPEEWLVLEDAADGWCGTTRWHSPEDFDGTRGQRRVDFRKKIEEIADDNDENQRGGADERDKAARAVPCPHCDVGAGQKCQRPSGHTVRKSHADRVQTALDEGVIATQENEERTEQAALGGWA